ncbi:PLP-dependent aminotransferase family protein [Parapusillimonas granuli]|uniref:PLP-dependent aminotransferase family protein n=1 Tax=Parapusillimonas granuli TaxID=380911 RepID=A0A853G020_9BURK|nr:PLP-dependent aminotransferase family protein [Parapusillimonas granuli]MBB5216513.1 DNA-binding transcriptional MocR family regulator [Parapusillimonas granuli]MEB2399744.1 PLP-dependent aminotransferase family protein [Alcaligenaceae bacterium]NYT48181.1 PLP-dependent aminotransferase family protein [Parapusillimonas granuli]
MDDWIDGIQIRGRPKHAALTAAILDAIESGKLGSGVQLPTQRDLAARLGMSVQTVSNCYQELQRRGVVSSVVGRGSFVTARAAAAGSFLAAPGTGDDIDLSVVQGIYTEAHETAARQLMQALSQEDNSTWMYPSRPVAGLVRHRDIAAGWLNARGICASTENLIITNGATQAIFLALAAVGRPGDTVLTEHLTENGIIGAANVLGLKLRGLPTDHEGVLPDAFDAACSQFKVAALVWVPTFGNPIGHLASLARREQIAAIAQRHGVAVIEDEVYRPLLSDSLPSISELVPELGFTVTSMTKSVMTGLRVGYLVAPHLFCLRIAGILRAVSWNTAPLMAEIAYSWMFDGTAARLIEVQRRELRARNAILYEELSAHLTTRHELSPTAWLNVPASWTEDSLIGVLRERGVLVTGSRPFAVDPPSRQEGIRIGLAGAVTQAGLRAGLQTIAATMEQLPTLSNVRV